MLGLIVFDWKRVLGVKGEFERLLRGPLLMFLLLGRSAIGSDIFTDGSIMYCMRDWMPRTLIGPEMFTSMCFYSSTIFKKYIEIELQLGNIDCCRKLYEKYLEWSSENCYAWSKNAELERSLAETERARAIFELAIDQPALDMPELIWKLVRVKLPKKLKKRQPLETVGGPAGYEEYIDYLFPEETETTNLKILEAAYKWKKQTIAPSEY
ncbi:hypothetical protein Leryth_025046 [Lithospermum erythrorhizon]|nr:hypothetical protein Leryth_025046 [Lithospermum erythrorhizon]